MLLSSVFIWEGIRQLADPSASAKYFARVHVPYPDIAIWVYIVINLGAGLALLVGLKLIGSRVCSPFSAYTLPLAYTCGSETKPACFIFTRTLPWRVD